MNYSEHFELVKQETINAYSDCNSLSKSRRNLDFRSKNSVSLIEAIEIMKLAVERGYNNFEPECLSALPRDCNVWLAREGSVCIYVDRELSSNDLLNLRCDEYDPSDESPNVYRVWWD